MTHSASSASMLLAIALLVPMVMTAQTDGNFMGVNIRSEPTAEERRAAIQFQFARFVTKDPWRNIDGKTNWAKGASWVQFAGRILEVETNGVQIIGTYGVPGNIYYSSQSEGDSKFFVKDFPYRVGENEIVKSSSNFTALYGDIYSYTNSSGYVSTLRLLTYGTPCSAPQPSEQQLKAVREAKQSAASAKEKVRQESEAKILKWNQDQAAQNDPYGLLRMGERYRDGEGVETNFSKAREYLTRSADLGNATAKEEVEKLP